MQLSVLMIALYLYSGPALIAVVFAYITYHVCRDWRRHRRGTQRCRRVGQKTKETELQCTVNLNG